MRRLVDPALRVARKVLPRPVKRLLKHIWDPNRALSLRDVAASLGKPRRDLYAPGCYPSRFDVVAFGAGALSSGLTEIARRGHRVFLVSDSAESKVEWVRDNAWRVRTPDLGQFRRDCHVITAVVSGAEPRFGWKTSAESFPRTSVVVVTYGNLDHTRACLASLFRNSVYPDLEVIVVDNASPDGTPAYLESLGDKIRAILNDTNRGFAAAMNQGLAVASGDYLVILNNDVVLPNAWLFKLVRHLEDPEVGLVVSVTNFSGNESRVEVNYRNADGMEEFARTYTLAHEGEVFDIRVAAMYCVALRREVYTEVGPLDEGFTIGMFEDDDYSHRVRLAGYRVVCAEDAFVHHFGQVSFRKLKGYEYEDLWKKNQDLFERKWNMTWTPHTTREE